MKKIKNLVIGGIEQKVFNLILITAVLIAAAFIAGLLYHNRMLADLTAETGEKQLQAVTDITSRVMEQVVDKSMDRTTYLESQISDELFHDLATRVEMLGEYAGKLVSEPESFPRMAWKGPDPAADGTITAQMIFAEGTDEEALADRLGLAANMSDLMISLFHASDITNSCFIALPEGAFLVVDDRAGSKFGADGAPVAYDPRTRPWYRQAVEAGKLIFTDVETDAFTGDIGIVCAMPVYVDGRLEAVVGSDLFLTSMQTAVEASDENGGFVSVVNNSGHVVFSPRTEGAFAVLRGSKAMDLRESENEALAALARDAFAGPTGVRLVETEEGSFYMSGAPMPTVGWALISVFDSSVADEPAKMLTESISGLQADAAVTYREKSARSRNTVLFLLAAALVLTCGGALVLGKRIVRPLNTITRRISELGEGNLEFRMEDAFRTGDEIEVLAGSFADLSHKTVRYMDQVKTVTAEKERINTELHMANQIQESMLPGIFPPFPDRCEFDLYAVMNPAREVGGDFYDFFLIDDDHLGIVMADVSGKGVPAALFMMASKIILQSCAMLGRSASEILTKTNEAICSNNRMQMFVTVWLGILEISTGKLTASNAGHEYPAAKKGTPFVLLRDRHGFVLGGMEDAKYSEYTLQLSPGDRLFLYTDGVAEATNAEGALFGTRRMLEALNRMPNGSPREILENVRRAVDEFVQDAEQFDDLTMLCLEYRGPQKD
ncbi:MAG: SpoIIE family protein phosphatase [Clostridia bacterium]|nr:SpoIIE family protein phosphatase [Clostridia bacterium]